METQKWTQGRWATGLSNHSDTKLLLLIYLLNPTLITEPGKESVARVTLRHYHRTEAKRPNPTVSQSQKIQIHPVVFYKEM